MTPRLAENDDGRNQAYQQKSRLEEKFLVSVVIVLHISKSFQSP